MQTPHQNLPSTNENQQAQQPYVEPLSNVNRGFNTLPHDALVRLVRLLKSEFTPRSFAQLRLVNTALAKAVGECVEELKLGAHSNLARASQRFPLAQSVHIEKRIDVANPHQLTGTGTASFPRLRTLKFSRLILSQQLAQSIVQLLTNHNHIQKLAFWCCTFNPQSLAKLTEALNQLEYLKHIELRNNYIPPNSLTTLTTALGKKKSLRHVDLMQNCIQSSAAFSTLTKDNSTVTTLNLGSNLTDNRLPAVLSQTLLGNNVLQQLLIPNNCLTNAGIHLLTTLLSQNKSIHTLDLSRNIISSGLAHELGESLSQNTTLTSLDLSDNPLGNFGMIHFIDGLQGNQSLTDLSINQIGLQNWGASVLSEGLIRNNPNFRKLSAHSNRISDFGLPAICAALETNQNNSQLESVDLSNHNFKTFGLDRLARALSVQINLRRLHLSHIHLHPQAMATLSRHFLRTATRLETLRLQGCQINAHTARLLAQGLQNSASLHTLDLSNNNIGNTGTSYIATLLNAQPIARIDLYRNKIFDTGIQHIETSLRTNTTLKVLNLKGNPVGEETRKKLSTMAAITHQHLRIDI